MFGFRTTRTHRVPNHTAPALADTGRDDALIAALDLLIAGRYLSVGAGACPVSRKIAELADTLHRQGLATAKGVVGVSMELSEAVTATAKMMREINEVDRRAQAIAVASEELVSSVTEISRNANAASAEAATARSLAASGRAAAEQAVGAMENIESAVRDASSKVDDLAAASGQIGEIIDQIEAIAAQTNLLALNATIEAARAGDAGKGFAVVASEVKSLAGQTAKATVDIRARIETLRREMSCIVTSMQQGAAAVHEGIDIISTTGQAMVGINAQTERLGNGVAEISAILVQQSAASQEIAQAITEVATMIEANARSVNDIIGLLNASDPTIATMIKALVGQELANITVVVAKSDHMIWRKRLAEMLVGKLNLDPAELSDHHTCRLGKWCDGTADAGTKAHPAFRTLEAPHREVHAHGIAAAKLYRAGDLDGAIREVDMAAEASKRVVACLDTLTQG
jgi:methyl-accepting chemotaxis protein